MILATRYAGDKRLFGPDTSRPAYGGQTAGRWAVSGELVSNDDATGLPAVGRAVRLISGLVASLRLMVFEGEREQRVARADSAVGRLLAAPVAGMSDFDWRWDIASSLEVCENAFLLKAKSRGQVVELHPVPCEYVRCWVDRQGRKVFELHTADGRSQVGEETILHVRGKTRGSAPFGVSRFEQHRDPLGSQLAAQRFEGSYFRNHARPDLALTFPQGVSREQAREWKEFWAAEYGGAGNAGQAIPLGHGADIKPIPQMSWRDAQFVEAKNLGVEDVGRIMDIDPVLLGAGGDQVDKGAALDTFLRVDFMPRLHRIARAFRADLDLFTLGDTLYPAFEISELIFASPVDRAQIQHEQIQDGRRLVDEIRAEEGLPPLPPLPADWTKEPGKVPQITPVGGAANPTVDTSEDTPSRNNDLEELERSLVAELKAQIDTERRMLRRAGVRSQHV